MVDVDLKQQQSSEQAELDAFDRLLARSPAEEQWVLEEEAEVEAEALQSHAA